MAILKRCCCFGNVRSGSIASGVYSLIYCLVSVGVLLWELLDYVEVSSYTGACSMCEEFTVAPTYLPLVNESARKGLFAAYSIDLVVLVFLFISTIILLVGIKKISKCMLIPYMVSIPLLMVCQLITWIIVFIFMGMGEVDSYVIDIVQCVIWFAITAPKILCLLCVISYYQELRDGRELREGHEYNMVEQL